MFILEEVFNRSDESHSYGSSVLFGSAKPNAKELLEQKAMQLMKERNITVRHVREFESKKEFIAVLSDDLSFEYSYYSMVVRKITNI